MGRFVLARWAVALVVVAGPVLGLADPAASGRADFEVLKIVEGTPPAGTQFVATLSCAGVTVSPGNSPEVTMTFDATGQPSKIFSFAGTGTCTLTETQTGGATSVSYECTRSQGGEGEGAPPPCVPSGPQAAPVVLNVVTPRTPASVVITNRFDSVTTRPDFTG